MVQTQSISKNAYLNGDFITKVTVHQDFRQDDRTKKEAGEKLDIATQGILYE